MKVYVASKFENKAAVRLAIECLKLDGHEITFDWTVHDDAGMSGQTREDYLLMSAEQDTKGVRDADVVLLLCHPNMKGAMVETGMALALGKPVLVVNREIWENVFFHLPLCKHFSSVGDAINEIRSSPAAKAV